MTWQEAKVVLQTECDQLRNPKTLRLLQENTRQGYPDPATAKKALIRQEQTLRDTIDRACKKFAQHRKWPMLNAEELVLLTHRLALALSFLRFLQTENQGVRIVPDPIPETPDWQVLEFLLVDYWHHIGHEQYLLQLTRLL